MVNLGINNDSINYEVALEVLGQSLQPFVMAIANERAKAEPSEALIAYYKAQMAAIGDLQDDLRAGDRAAIERILDPNDSIFGRHHIKEPA